MGEVGEIVGVVANIEEGRFGGKVGILLSDCDVYFRFVVKMRDYVTLGLLR